MDGAVISSKVEVDEGHCITLDLCLKEALPGEAEILTKPCRSQAVHQMLDGKLIYLGTKTLT